MLRDFECCELRGGSLRVALDPTKGEGKTLSGTSYIPSLVAVGVKLAFSRVVAFTWLSCRREGLAVERVLPSRGSCRREGRAKGYPRKSQEKRLVCRSVPAFGLSLVLAFSFSCLAVFSFSCPLKRESLLSGLAPSRLLLAGRYLR